jgi:Flp pilus assembly protein protease CpaA
MSNMFQVVILVAFIFITYATHRNVQEIHKHTHELGCALDYEPLCRWKE